MQTGNVLASRVTLKRNVEGLPFGLAGQKEAAEGIIARTVHALKAEGLRGYTLLRLRDMGENDRQVLAEKGDVTREMLSAPETAAILQNPAEGVVIRLCGADHLCIRGEKSGSDLSGAMQAALRVEDALSRQMAFAWDERLGYLTSALKDVGTGMRASLVMHLPMLMISKRPIGKEALKDGLELRTVFGGDGADPACLYEVCNRATLGGTEQEAASRVAAMGAKLCTLEQEMRDKAMQEGRIAMEDIAGRAWGTLLHARLMTLPEFYRHWSNLRLGAMLGLVGVAPEVTDTLLLQAQTAHLRAYAGHDMTPEQLQACRASRIRALIYRP